MRMFFSLIFFILTACFSSLYSLKPFTTLQSMILESQDIQIYQKENISLRKINQKYAFQIDENINPNISSFDLYLDFDSPLNNLLNYKIIYSKFELNKYQNINGDFSGKFYFSDNYISLLPMPGSIFAPGNITGSFSVDFWLYVYKNYDNQYILKYIGNNLSNEKDKNIYGFSIYIKNSRIKYEFDNFFFTENNESVSLDLNEEEKIVLNKWEHHALTFDIKNGKIAVYKNGIEQDVKWVTEKREPLSAVLTPRIKEELSAPILIGKDALFSIDNLKISKGVSSGFDLKKFNSKNAFIITDVYKYSENKAALKKISFQSETPDYSYIKYAYRISDSYFLPGNTSLKWVYLQNGAEAFPSGFDSGKYIQFKIMVYPYEDLDKEIDVYSIKFDYSIDNSPDQPLIVNTVPLDQKVQITWIPSPEDDIAGYEIYYGNRMGDYICDDALEGKSPVYVSANEPGKINPMNFSLNGLVNEKPYFISIRSIDKNGHRSAYSKEVYARPSSVYNSDKYSIDR